jgi:hypothetical protein
LNLHGVRLASAQEWPPLLERRFGLYQGVQESVSGGSDRRVGAEPAASIIAGEAARLQADCGGELRQHSAQRAPRGHDALVMWLMDAP